MRLQQSKHQAISMIAAVAGGGMIFAASTAFAEPDMYYMHNGSAYYVWSNRQACEHDLRSSGNACKKFGRQEMCGVQLYSTQATLNVAIDKANRKEDFELRNLSNNSHYCPIDN